MLAKRLGRGCLRVIAAAASPFRWLWKSATSLLRRIGKVVKSPFRWLGKWVARGLRSLKSRRVWIGIAAVAVAFGIGLAVSQAWLSDGSDEGAREGTPTSPADPPDGASEPTATPSEPEEVPPTSDPTPTPEPTLTPDPTIEPPPDDPQDNEPTPTATTTPIPTPTPAPTPVFLVVDQEPQSYQEALEDATRLAPSVVWPSDCMSPLPHPDLLPNSPRNYRSGVHQGVDFRCFAPGRSAVAAMDGRVVFALGNYEDAESSNRIQLLNIASQVGATPPFTLLMLYGNFVVIDHGAIPDVGHVVTLYTHLEEVDPDIRLGQTIQAGQRVGEIGNRGTHAAANGDFYNDPHLHWELHINNQYLGAGLSAEETRHVYTALFDEAS